MKADHRTTGEQPLNRILKYGARLCGWVVGLIFIYAGLTKILAVPEVSFASAVPQIKPPEGGIRLIPTQDFAKAIGNYKLLPGWLNRAMAATLPWIEIAAGLALCTRRYRYEGALAVAAMLLTFMAALTHALRNKLDIACGCFSVSERAQKLSATTLLFDVALLLLVGIIIAGAETERRRRQRHPPSPIRPAG
jgi:hypothetical protein